MALSYQTTANRKEPDLIIIGGGIIGMWTALFAAMDGLRIRLIEKETLGSGASGGMLGALMPHQPSGWADKKQYQFDGLLSLPFYLNQLIEFSGLPDDYDFGYGRVGRLMPIAHAEKRRQSQAWVDGARDYWQGKATWQVLEDNPNKAWANSENAPHGWNHDTLSARINPRRLTHAMAGVLRASDGIDIQEHTEVRVLPKDGPPVILTAGTGCFPLIDLEKPGRIGKGVKGQGALLKAKQSVDPNSPILYDNGTYVIAHTDGTIAVGSTSENSFEHPTQTDEKLDDVIKAAKRLCPALENAEVIERWAGVRPKAGKPDPLIGYLPDQSNVVVATGGFKITFAIAHLMAKDAIKLAMGDDEHLEIPQSFDPANRLKPKTV